MLGARLATIAFWLPVHLAILIWGRPYHFLIYLAAISAVGLLEMFNLSASAGYRPHRLAVLVAGTVYMAAVAYRPAVAFGAAAALVVAVLAAPVARGRGEGALGDAGASLLAFVYVPFLVGFLMLVRRLSAGVELLLIFFITIWIMDIAAYICGRAFGHRPLAPRLSPGKTVWGAVAGAAAGLAAAVLLARFAFPRAGLTWPAAAAVGVVLVVGDFVGDLAESALKRDAGVKDAGRMLPGHGGVLDRFDAVLFAAPLFYGTVRLLARAG